MLPDGKMDLFKGIKSTENGKWVNTEDFSNYLII